MGHVISWMGTPALFRTDMFHYTSFKTATFFTKHFEITFGGATEWKIHRHNLFLFVCATLINYAPVGFCSCKSFHQCVQNPEHTSRFECSSSVSEVSSVCYKGRRHSTMVCFLSVTFHAELKVPCYVWLRATWDSKGTAQDVSFPALFCPRPKERERAMDGNPRLSPTGLFVSCSCTLSHFTVQEGQAPGIMGEWRSSLVYCLCNWKWCMIFK